MTMNHNLSGELSQLALSILVRMIGVPVNTEKQFSSKDLSMNEENEVAEVLEKFGYEVFLNGEIIGVWLPEESK